MKQYCRFMTVFVLAIIIGLTLSMTAFAADATPAPTPSVLYQNDNLTITAPLSASAVGFWDPKNGVVGAGVATTFLEFTSPKVPNFALDADVAVAQGFASTTNSTTQSEATNTTYAGLGVKLKYSLSKVTQTGLSFDPSLGVALLNDYSDKTAAGLVKNMRPVLYGTLFTYKFW